MSFLASYHIITYLRKGNKTYNINKMGSVQYYHTKGLRSNVEFKGTQKKAIWKVL